MRKKHSPGDIAKAPGQDLRSRQYSAWWIVGFGALVIAMLLLAPLLRSPGRPRVLSTQSRNVLFLAL
jgi:hypothetical protein